MKKKTSKPTEQQIEENLKWLKENKSKIPAMNIFGERNDEKIDAEIRVLEERMTEEQVEDEWGMDVDDDEQMRRIYDSAMDTLNWMSGEDPTSPKENWEPLVKKGER